jgi:hypothetical protein
LALVRPSARADFGGTLLGFVFDWKGWIAATVGGSGGAMTFLKAAIDGRSPLDVWVFALVVVAALVAIVYFSISILEKYKKSETADSRAVASASNEFAGDIPDVRVADDTVVLRLFSENHERDKLIPLLEGGKIDAWGRSGNGYPPPIKIPVDSWRTSYLDHHPATPGQFISQTFLRPKARPYESTYYDVHLNRAQLKKAWPDLWNSITLLEAATRAYEQTRDKIVSGAAELFEGSPDDVLTWYCNAMARPQKGKALVTLWGIRPPSRQLEQIYIQPLNRYEFVVENQAIILKPPTGGGQFERIMVDENQVAAAIEEIAQWGG